MFKITLEISTDVSTLKSYRKHYIYFKKQLLKYLYLLYKGGAIFYHFCCSFFNFYTVVFALIYFLVTEKYIFYLWYPKFSWFLTCLLHDSQAWNSASYMYKKWKTNEKQMKNPLTHNGDFIGPSVGLGSNMLSTKQSSIDTTRP